MKYFVLSDIHGYYSVLQQTLSKVQFDTSNANHHLIIVGDMFDRGPHSSEVYHFLKKLHDNKKASIIIGNHDTFLRDYLQGNNSRVMFNILYNGFGETIESFSGVCVNTDNIDEIRTRILTDYPDLLSFLESLPYYFELGDYIFVHGGIDGGTLDWKTLSSEHDFIWSREHLLPSIPGKTVVAGHTRVATIRKKTTDYELLFLHHPEMFDILYLEGKILIDRFVEVTQELNVLIIDI